MARFLVSNDARTVHAEVSIDDETGAVWADCEGCDTTVADGDDGRLTDILMSAAVHVDRCKPRGE